MKTCTNTNDHRETTKPSSLYKGVVSQHNGRWGAQIYERHRRIWLGTFPDEIMAAKAYDTAARRFRGAQAVTNFKSKSESNPDDETELAFLFSHSKEEIVDMLRKHTYDVELKQSLRKRKLSMLNSSSGGDIITCDKPEFKYLFHKAVTPSDVGKLNRLVIPKIHAVKHFKTFVDPKGVLINFEDGEGKVWRFRYAYWKSSQSHVLTKGWSRFVKEKGMKVGDVVSFWRYSDGAGFTELLIDCKILKLGNGVPSFVGKSVELSDNNDGDGDEVIARLFGVDICKGQCNNGGLNMDKDITHKTIQTTHYNDFLHSQAFGMEKKKERREIERREEERTRSTIS